MQYLSILLIILGVGFLTLSIGTIINKWYLQRLVFKYQVKLRKGDDLNVAMIQWYMLSIGASMLAGGILCQS